MKKNIDIDIGISVLCALMRPDESLSDRDIADVCGCSRNYIYEIEKRALKKIRFRMLGWK